MKLEHLTRPTARHFLLLALIGLFIGVSLALPAPAFAQDGSTSEPDPLSVLVKLATGFAALAGVAALVSGAVNLLKLTPFVNDGNSGRVVAVLGFLAFCALGYFQIFRPDISLLALDGYAAQAATLLVFVTGYLTQTGLTQVWYGVLKRLKVPGVSKSFSLPTESLQHPPVSKRTR